MACFMTMGREDAIYRWAQMHSSAAGQHNSEFLKAAEPLFVNGKANSIITTSSRSSYETSRSRSSSRSKASSIFSSRHVPRAEEPELDETIEDEKTQQYLAVPASSYSSKKRSSSSSSTTTTSSKKPGRGDYLNAMFGVSPK